MRPPVPPSLLVKAVDYLKAEGERCIPLPGGDWLVAGERMAPAELISYAQDLRFAAGWRPLREPRSLQAARERAQQLTGRAAQPTPPWIGICSPAQPRTDEEEGFVPPSRCLAAAAAATGVPVEVLVGPRRSRRVARARWIAWALLRRHGRLKSAFAIGRTFHRDHTTILYAQRETEALLASDADFAATFERAEAAALDPTVQETTDMTTLQADPLADVKRKIAALLSRTEERGCSEAEALACAQKAAELLQLHGLSEDLVQPFASVRLTCRRGRHAAPWWYLWGSIGHTCCVKPWSQDGAIVYFGIESDVLLAEYLHQVAERLADRARAAFLQSTEYRRRRVPRTRAEAMRAFLEGYCRALSSKILQAVPRRSEAEVERRRAAITAELERQGLEFGKARSRKRKDLSKHQGFVQGVIAGSQEKIHAGVGQTRGTPAQLTGPGR